MKATIAPPPPPPEREVTITMTQAEATLLKHISGSTTLGAWEALAQRVGPNRRFTGNEAHRLAADVYAVLHRIV